jgi:hypothetical protein
MIDEFQEFAYLQENPTYQQDWDAAFYKNHSEPSLNEIKEFISSHEGWSLAQKYGLICAYYYGIPLAEQLTAIHRVDLAKALLQSIPIFLFEHLPRTVRVIPHAPARWNSPEGQEQIEQSPQPGHFLHRIDALMDKSHHLEENQYLKVQIDITRTNKEIFEDLRALLRYYREQIGPVKQENKSLTDYDPLKVWKLVVGKLGKTTTEYKEAKSILWQLATDLDKDQNTYDLWSEMPKTTYREDSPEVIYGKLQNAYHKAHRKILAFTPSTSSEK